MRERSIGSWIQFANLRSEIAVDYATRQEAALPASLTLIEMELDNPVVLQ